MRSDKKKVLVVAAACALLVAVAGGVVWHGTHVLSEEQLEHAVSVIEGQMERQQVSRASIPAALEAAVEANPHACAWLWVPGTNVSLPVMRHPSDDAYYQRHDAEGAEPSLGAAYMERANSASFDDPVTVLYGHTFEDAEVMFTQLHRFEDAAFFKEYEGFCIYLPDRVLTYAIASAAPYRNVHILGTYDFSDPGVLQGYLDFAVNPGSEGSHVRKVRALVAGEDRIVQLSTCLLPQVDGGRYVVTGVLVGEQEL